MAENNATNARIPIEIFMAVGIDAATLIAKWIRKWIQVLSFGTSPGNLEIGGRAGLFFAWNAGRTVRRIDRSGANIRG
jgi:hypothetical protein